MSAFYLTPLDASRSGSILLPNLGGWKRPLLRLTPLDAEKHPGTRSAVASFDLAWPSETTARVTDLFTIGDPEDRVLEDVILAPHAVKRLIEPEEVAEAVAYLLGPGGRSMTGVPLTMDLGWTAR